MKVLFFSKKSILITLLLLLILVNFFYSDYLIEKVSAPVIAEAYYQGSDKEKNISIAINVDWGEEYIPDILNILKAEGIRVTFFLTGRWAENNVELAKQIKEMGHEIGNHGYSHKSPNKSTYEENIKEIKLTENAIFAATEVKTILYAPPSGERENHVLKAAQDMGYYTILWSIDTIDWQRPESSVIINRVKNKVKEGGIILAHPTNPTLEALSSIIKFLKEQGYNIIPVSENLGIMGEKD